MKKVILIFSLIIIFINLIAIFHAYAFTHYSLKKRVKTERPEKLTFSKKIKTLVLGISIPKPKSENLNNYQSMKFNYKSDTIEMWFKQSNDYYKSVILFHGYSSSKESLLTEAEEFYFIKMDIIFI